MSVERMMSDGILYLDLLHPTEPFQYWMQYSFEMLVHHLWFIVYN